jgi:hypothetical protein
MQYFGDYRRKYYLILILIFLFIYFTLYSRTDNKKKKQLLSKGLVSSSNASIFYLSFFSLISSTSRLKKKQFICLSKKFRNIRFIFVDSIMNHDHAAMVASTTPSMLHDHLAGPGLNSSEQGGLGMMMMAVSIRFHVE